jgi:uncharacterized protein YeeX (DUF496 family)
MKLNFIVSSKRIEAAIKEGIVLKSKMTLEVDLETLSVPERETLSRNIQYNTKEDSFNVYLLNSDNSDYRYVSEPVSSEKISDIIEEMRKREEARAKKVAIQGKEISLKEEIDSLLSAIDDDTFRIEIYDFTHLKFVQKNGGNYKSFSFKGVKDASSMLEFVKTSPEVLETLNKVKAEYVADLKAAADKAAAEAAKKSALESGRAELLAWAKENGSELLKLRIKHGQNWESIAEAEWAKANIKGEFESWNYEPDSKEDWTVNNATLQQLQELEKAEAENPDCEIDIMRSKFDCEMYDEDDTQYIHRTFLRCGVKTPTSTRILYREISDISDNE